MSERYWLKADFNKEWTEVSKAEWIKAERAAGFRPKLWSGDPNYMAVCATGGWGGAGVQGRITRDEAQP